MGIIENLENIEDRLNIISKAFFSEANKDEKSLQNFLAELDIIAKELNSANSKFLNKELIKSLLRKAKTLTENIEDELKFRHNNDQ